MLRKASDNPPLRPDAAGKLAPNYALALRVIGQNLSRLFPKVLEIEIIGTDFEAHGDCHPNPFETLRDRGLTKVLNKLRGVETAQSSAPAASFLRRYRPAVILRLDKLYRGRRSGPTRRADSYTLAERLRTLGAIVDARNGRLKHLRKESDRFVVEYWDPQSQLQSAKLTGVILYRNQQQLETQRRQSAPELWEGYDF